MEVGDIQGLSKRFERFPHVPVRKSFTSFWKTLYITVSWMDEMSFIIQLELL